MPSTPARRPASDDDTLSRFIDGRENATVWLERGYWLTVTDIPAAKVLYGLEKSLVMLITYFRLRDTLP